MGSRGVQSVDANGRPPPSADHLRASPRLFDNPLLDKLSRVHWSMPLFFYAPFMAWLAWLSFSTIAPAMVVFATSCGYAAWTLTEYFGHRWLFHAEFPGSWGARIHFLIHGVHHEHPNDPLRLVMPPLLSAPIMATAFLVILAIAGRPLAYPDLMGFILGYLIYDMVHYRVHHAEPKTQFGRTLKRLHMLHHFRDAERGFGVSAPWWDRLFGTEHLPAPATPRRN
jgi:dihydroceramide fatty acyl 2-hydroxylase